MRARLIKPGFYKSDELAELPPLARILFSGLWCLADRAGRLKDRPRAIKAEVLPYDDCDVDAFLDALADAGFIVRYGAAPDRYIQVVNFGKHQTPHVKEQASLIPAPDEHQTSPMPDRSLTLNPIPLSLPPVLSEPTGETAQAPPRTRPDLRKPKDREKSAIEQHPLFPVIDEFFGPIIPSRWSAIAKNLHDLDALGATPEDLRYRASAYPAVMGIDPNGKPFARTLPALINNWQRCAPPGLNGKARAPTPPPRLSPAEAAERRRQILAGEDIT